jgi:hypothetical protein
MENFINSLPKPVLALLVIIVGIVVFFMIQPPHTVCDTQAEALQEAQRGVLFPAKEKKNVIPPSILRSKEACQLGNSAGSCYEYFLSLRKVADDITKSSAECAAQLYELAEVRTALNDGLEMMVRLAWGLKPPEPTLERFGWMQESEISTFCRLRTVYVRANGEDAWVELRRKISTKLPGEEVPVALEPGQATVEPRMATTLMSEQDIWNRSLFSARCDVF